MFARVVWILSLTIDTRESMSALRRVDLPAFVGPIRQHASERDDSGLATSSRCGTDVADAPATRSTGPRGAHVLLSRASEVRRAAICELPQISRVHALPDAVARLANEASHSPSPRMRALLALSLVLGEADAQSGS